jgi:hypothetical protein
MQPRLPFVASPAPVPDAAELYFVRHQRARRYLLRVEPTGRVRVTIPRGGSRREAEAFAIRQQTWIARQRARLAAHAPLVRDEQRAVLRARAAVELPRELLALAARYGLAVSKVTVRNQRSRWGSCGRDGHITLNWRLVVMPDWVREYVLVHELMHLERLDHSPAYWERVRQVSPRFEVARAWLRRHGPALL